MKTITQEARSVLALRALADEIAAGEYPVMAIEINRALSSLPESPLNPNPSDAQRLLMLLFFGCANLPSIDNGSGDAILT